MYFDYFEMLSGEPILLNHAGHVKSPLLRSICPSSGIGYREYNFYLNFLSWNKEQLLKYDSLMDFRGADKLQREELTLFDAITLLPQTRELCREILSFFISDQVVWDQSNRCYLTQVYKGEVATHVGTINRKNYHNVCEAILQLNFIGLDKDDQPVRHTSEKSKELWERAQSFLKEQTKKAPKEKNEYNIGNIVSKLCAAHPSYNFLNIFDLTVFQLYDAFFQFGYMRNADLNEKIFSSHGGKKFKFEDWLKPILNK